MGFIVPVERDPGVLELERKVLAQLAACIPPDTLPIAPTQSKRHLPSDNLTISPEAALEELRKLSAS